MGNFSVLTAFFALLALQNLPGSSRISLQPHLAKGHFGQVIPSFTTLSDFQRIKSLLWFQGHFFSLKPQSLMLSALAHLYSSYMEF